LITEKTPLHYYPAILTLDILSIYSQHSQINVSVRERVRAGLILMLGRF